MQINFNVNLERLRQKQKQKTKTGMSMQSTVNGALALPINNTGAQMPQPNKSNGWGSNVQ